MKKIIILLVLISLKAFAFEEIEAEHYTPTEEEAESDFSYASDSPDEEKIEVKAPIVETKDIDPMPLQKESPIQSLYFIQMGSFKDNENARKLIGLIKTYDYSVATSFYPRKHDTLTVVFIGPFRDKQDTLKNKKFMERKTKLKTKIIETLP
jgi:cell division septation protein DedD